MKRQYQAVLYQQAQYEFDSLTVNGSRSGEKREWLFAVSTATTQQHSKQSEATSRY